MKVNSILVLGAIGVGAYLYTKFVNVPNSLVFETPGVSNFKLEGTSVKFDLHLPVRNNASVSVPFDGFYGNLYYGNTSVSTIEITKPVVLKSWETVEMIAEVTIGIMDALNLTLAGLTSGDWLQEATLKGTGKSGMFIYPIESELVDLNALQANVNSI